MRIGKIARAVGAAVLLAGLASLGGAVKAQAAGQSTSQAPPNPPPGRNVTYFRAGPGPMGTGDAMDFVGFEAGLGGKTVAGAPFTATISTQRTEVLADGNRIDRTTTGTIARDSEGSVRRDMTLPAIGAWATSNQGAPHVIFINDAVSKMQYILEPDRKIAHEVRAFRGRRHIRIDRNLAPAADAGNVTTTSLGTQTINGVQVQGMRYTHTIPAGQIGNEKPIVITTERWYSPELQMYVLTKTTDPMRGDSVRQLTNIQMGEPDPSLFQVPPDYTVEKGNFQTIRRRRRLGAPPTPPPPPQN
ncbi:MAG: hypothetical protein ACRD4R_03005 [Candidatus Acidiferrales bacterium]